MVAFLFLNLWKGEVEGFFDPSQHEQVFGSGNSKGLFFFHPNPNQAAAQILSHASYIEKQPRLRLASVFLHVFWVLSNLSASTHAFGSGDVSGHSDRGSGSRHVPDGGEGVGREVAADRKRGSRKHRGGTLPCCQSGTRNVLPSCAARRQTHLYRHVLLQHRRVESPSATGRRTGCVTQF